MTLGDTTHSLCLPLRLAIALLQTGLCPYCLEPMHGVICEDCGLDADPLWDAEEIRMEAPR